MKLQPGNRLVDSKGSVLVVEEKAWDNGWTCEGLQLSKPPLKIWIWKLPVTSKG